ncbi:MAG: histone deacetylase family protein [Gammaproteobacteria bacterium]|nr:histone deacetylase family protein [Gammaproteobacteria bacterium]
MGESHPESPDRLTAIYSNLEDLIDSHKLFQQEPLQADAELIQLAHQHGMVEHIFNLSPCEGYVVIDPDTQMNAHSLKAARLAAGAGISALQLIEDETQKSKQAFCLTRPPGHHAEHNRAMGFCLFNNIAITAIYAAQNLNYNKILIIDFDVHHGNGTEDIVKGHPNISLISSFQHPWYPGSGVPAQSSNIFNFPLYAGSGSEVIGQLWRDQIIPITRRIAPDLILVSAGFDAHQEDPLAQLNFLDEDYFFFGKTLAQLANEFCNGKVISFLEGGYQLDALARSVRAYIQGQLSESR